MMYREQRYLCKCGMDFWLFLPAKRIPRTAHCPTCGKRASKAFCGCPAVVGTDTQYFRQRGTLEKQFNSDHDLKIRVEQARKHGYNPNPNDVYEPCLAQFPGDPNAFISPSQGKRQIRQAAAKICAPKPAKDGLAENLIQKYSRDMVKEHPSMKRLKPSELREAVLDKHALKV
jgi:hypothetical protein